MLLNGDFTLESNETVGLSLTGSHNAVLGTPSAATLTIASDDLAGTIEFDQSTYTVNESVGLATITLRRTGGLAAGITALVSTVAGGTATATADYTAFTNKVVTFAGGATTASFTVSIVNDTLAEANETVRLQISSVSPPAGIGVRSTATLTIQSEDIAGTVQFSAPVYHVTEGTATAVITVNRVGSSSGTTVRYRAIGGTAEGTLSPKDYTLAGGILTFNANETVKTFSVTIANDIDIEPDETVILELYDPSVGLGIGLQGSATLIIYDNDAPTIKFGATTYRTVEGTPGAVVVVRTGGLGSPVTVGYQVVVGGTATGSGVNADYALTNGTLTFAKGISSVTLSVPTTSDTTYEPDETVIIRLHNPSAGVVGTPDTTTLTIADNDAPGTFQFSAAAYSAWENAGAATVRVTRTGTNLASGITVQLTTTNGTATAGPDYTDVSQTLTFAALEAFKDVTIPIRDDLLPEGNETVLLSLAVNPSTGATLGATKTAVLTILDDEQTLQFSAPVYVVNESAGIVTVTVNRSGPTVGSVTVDYATAAGTATSGLDYTDVSGTLTFAAGIASRTFTVPIVNDTLFEGAESIAVVLRHPGGVAQLGPLSTATITILDNDPPGAIRFSASAYTVSESAGVATITAQRTPGATASAVTVDYATVAGGTATPGADYMLISGTLTFKAGELTKAFTVPIVNDNFDEPSETVQLALSNPTGGATLGTPVTAVLTISDEDVPGAIGFSLSAYTVLESAGLALIPVTRTGTAGAVTVDFTTADGSAIAPVDYAAVSGTLSFGGGETTKTVAIPILEDGLREGNETIRLILSNPTGGATLSATTSQAVLTITDNETGPVVQFGASAYSVAENVTSGMATVTITRTGSTAAGDTVLFRTLTGGTAVPGTDYTSISNLPVTFAAGQTTTTVQVPIVNNTNIVGSRTVDLALTSPSVGLSLGSPRTAVLTILEDDATIQFASATTSVTEGSNALLTVTRTGGTVSAATVSYLTISGTATGGSDYTSKAGTLTFAAGVISQTITIATTSDTAVESAKAFTVVLSTPAGATLGATTTATVTINDNDAFGTLQFASAAYTVNEGLSASLVVTRTGGNAGPVTVAYQTTDGGGGGNAATGGGIDYTTTAGVLTFLNGVVSQTIVVPTKADTFLEGPESFTVTLSAPGGGAGLGTTAATVVTIVDDETPRLQFAVASYTVAEATGSVTLTVQRLGPTTTQNTVQYSLAGVTAIGGGVDFDSTGGTLTFAPGIASRTIVVPITKDTINEGAETFTATLVNAGGGAVLGTIRTATVTITDDDPAGTVQFSQLSYAVIEGGTATITVTRTGTSGPVAVSFATSNGTASQPADYTGRVRDVHIPGRRDDEDVHRVDRQRRTHRGQRVGEPGAVQSDQRSRARHSERGHPLDPRRPADGAVRRHRLHGDRGRIRQRARHPGRRSRRDGHRELSGRWRQHGHRDLRFHTDARPGDPDVPARDHDRRDQGAGGQRRGARRSGVDRAVPEHSHRRVARDADHDAGHPARQRAARSRRDVADGTVAGRHRPAHDDRRDGSEPDRWHGPGHEPRGLPLALVEHAGRGCADRRRADSLAGRRGELHRHRAGDRAARPRDG